MLEIFPRAVDTDLMFHQLGVMDTTGGARAVTLPAANQKDNLCGVLNIGTNAVTVTSRGTGNTFSGGGSSYSVAVQYQCVIFISDGAGVWRVLSSTALQNLGTTASPTFANLTLTGKINGLKVYRALLAQTGTAAPTATVLENSLGGTVVWTRSAAGVYIGTLASAFPANKTVLSWSLAGVQAAGGNNVLNLSCERNDNNSISVKTSRFALDDLGSGIVALDEMLNSNAESPAMVTILVYP